LAKFTSNPYRILMYEGTKQQSTVNANMQLLWRKTSLRTPRYVKSAT